MDAPLVRYDGVGTSNKSWLLADERGSIIAETSTTGAVVQVNSYDDYGVPASGNVGRFGYTGQLWLAEIGMYSYKNRIYHPGLARFLQPDPIGLAGGMNLYAYVGGDPINFTDPWGLRRLVSQVGCISTYAADWAIYRDGRRVASGTHYSTETDPGCQGMGIHPDQAMENFLRHMVGGFLGAPQAGWEAAVDRLCPAAASALRQVPAEAQSQARDQGGHFGVLIGAQVVVGGGVSTDIGAWRNPSSGDWGLMTVAGVSGGMSVNAARGTFFVSNASRPGNGFGLQAAGGLGPASAGIASSINDQGRLSDVSGSVSVSPPLLRVPFEGVAGITATGAMSCQN